MSEKLAIVRGTTNSFGISVFGVDGKPYVLEENQVLVFGLKRKLTDNERVLIKTITNKVDDAYLLELTPEDTANLETGKYYYDVGLQYGDSVFYNVIEASGFEIKPNITELGDGS